MMMRCENKSLNKIKSQITGVNILIVLIILSSSVWFVNCSQLAENNTLQLQNILNDKFKSTSNSNFIMRVNGKLSPSKDLFSNDNNNGDLEDNKGLNREMMIHLNKRARVSKYGNRRNRGTSLSISNPLDVLRQKLLLEIVRRRMQSQKQIVKNNAEYLRNLGR